MVCHSGKMPEADVVYSDVKFTKSNGNTTVAAPVSAETTYSQINILKAASTTELPDFQQRAASGGGSKVRPERVVIVVLSGLLAAAVIALGFIYFKNLQTTERLQRLNVEHEAVKKNLTEKRCEVCEVKTCSCPVQDRRPLEPKVPTEPTLTCDDGWDQHGNKCYYFSNDKLTWDEARVKCRHQGADLVQIDSREEQTFLVQQVSEKMNEDEDKFWIGLTDSQNEGSWLWVDGSILKHSLSFWSLNEPDNWPGGSSDGEDCVRMGEKAGAAYLNCWFDKSCETPHRHICEKPGSPKCI